MNAKSIINLALKVVPAIILLQTLFFKFSAAPESVFIFETLGIGIGILELITAILLLVPRTTWLGAILGIGLMVGAIFLHLTQLGIVVQNDGGALFILAVVTLIFCGILAWMNRHQIPVLRKLFPQQKESTIQPK
jgi:uncharacterized membrane protein YphA (DoxX/SURF4 family)